MALSLAGFQSRISSELALLGDFSEISTDMIKDALTQFCIFVEPDIYASLAITSSEVKYAIPSTIDKVSEIEDSNENRLLFDVDYYLQ
jgi:hypothetical protein